MTSNLCCCRRCPFVLLAAVLSILSILSRPAVAQSGVGVCCTAAAGCVANVPASQCPGAFFDGATSCDPNPCVNTGACCRGIVCSLELAAPCTANGGTYLGGACTMAGAVVCPDPNAQGACCDPTTGGCGITTQINCRSPKVWYANTSCGSSTTANPCGNPGACCIPGASCFAVATASQCNGTFYPNIACTDAPCTQTGACCPPTGGQCTVTTQAGCGSGQWYGPGSACSTVVCGQTGSCCSITTGVCYNSTPANCPAPGSIFTPGGTCATNPCPKGACCIRQGATDQCVLTLRSDCDALQGVWMPNTPCNPNPCPQVRGACCIMASSTAAGGCIFVLASQCPTGNQFFPGVTCNPNPCPPITGACCCPGQACHVVPQSQCNSTLTTATAAFTANCEWFPNQACTSSLCPALGACCTLANFPCPATPACPAVPAGSCTITTLACCCGHWFASTTCNPSPCPAIGACCTIDGACTLISSASACNGHWFLGVPCNPNPCLRGGCCNRETGNCLITTQAQCDAHGLAWLGAGVPCSVTNCPPRRGACCVAGTIFCTITSPNACNGIWYGNTPCQPNPCCPANFSGSGTLAVADIFQFLNQWFAGCP
ncbi:MAG TPA: hypothetical protein VHC70_12300 [Phycisphaerales bacterium]|nr:hypothetical protein [Phycisphaerales bacterium]